MNDKIITAKERLTIPDVWRILGLEGNPQKVCRSPWREDKTPSLSIFDGGKAFKDHGDGSGGDVICFIEQACGISRKEAVKKFLDMAGMRNEIGTLTKPVVPVESFKQRDRPNLPVRSTGNDETHRRLADLRGVSLSAVKGMIERGLLWFCQYEGSECWLIADEEGVNAQVRKLSGERFGDKKAKTLTGSWAKWPIGIGSVGEKILLVEGGPDLLAAHDEIMNSNWSPVCMFGATLEIHPAALPLFYRKEVCIIPHNDSAGRDAKIKWSNQLKGVAAKVWARELPPEVNDLNDWVEAERRKAVSTN